MEIKMVNNVDVPSTIHNSSKCTSFVGNENCHLTKFEYSKIQLFSLKNSSPQKLNAITYESRVSVMRLKLLKLDPKQTAWIGLNSFDFGA